MRLALRELRRQPGRFAIATFTLTLIAVLLMFLGGLLDGLIQSATGAYRAQPGQLIVYSADANDSLAGSRIDGPLRKEVESAVGAAGAVGGIGEVTLGARVEGGDERAIEAVSLRGYEIAPAGLPADLPAAGEVWADPDLAETYEVGQVLLLGPARSEVTIAGFLEESATPSLGGVWGSLDTWRTVVAEARPGAAMGEDTAQGLVVVLDDDGAAADVAAAIDGATGATRTLTLDDAVNAIPGVSAQQSTFGQIIGVTLAIALVVVALFFALLTVERLSLYAVLKAIGAKSRTIFSGVVAQALVVTLIAALVGVALTLAAGAFIPAGSLPFAVEPARLLTSVGLMAFAAMVGSAFSLRRVLRIDPAEAIGGN